MTHEEFKAICLREYPKIEGMVKTVKALGIDYVSCSVYADGHINFDIHEKDSPAFHTSWHCAGPKDGELRITEYDEDHKSWWAPKCYYDHAIDNDPDGVEDDIPVQ
jgi:hypothetical protein